MFISTTLLGYSGGVLTNQRKPNDKSEPSDRGRVNCLCPSDLMPFTRRPLFLIVDSNNSVAFKVTISSLICWRGDEYTVTIICK